MFISATLHCLLDKNKEIRLLAEQLLAQVIALIGKEPVQAALTEFKPALA